MKSKLVRWGAVALMIGTLAGCGGGSDSSSGSGGTTTPPPVSGSGAPTVAAPTGTAPITLTSSTPAATFAALEPVVKVGGVSISSPPQVAFSIADANNNPIIGWGATSQSATATLPGYANLAFALAKLVPGTNGSPSKWVSYIVTTVPTKNATTGAITASVPTRPSTDNTGTLVDNKNGTYLYTFYRDITKVKEAVASATLTAPSVAADLGDLTYDPALTHRLVIQVSGNAPGTGSNTANGVTVTPAVAMANPVNAIYDFIPATGKAVSATDTQRNIVDMANCNECHGKIGTTTPHGGRVDTKYCVMCHTDQRKFGRAEATTTVTGYSGSTYKINGKGIGDFPSYIHKIHMGERLSKTGYNYGNVLFNDVVYPQDQTNCTKCHDGSATATTKTTQGDNWMKAPSALACGACHDGINWATGKGIALGVTGKAVGGHAGGPQSSDAICAQCHGAADITLYHLTVNATPHNLGVPAGLVNFTYDVNTVTVNASNQPVVKFKILKQSTSETTATPVVFNGTSTNPLTGFTGSPSFLVAYASAQDGIAAPVDHNNLGKAAAQPQVVTIASVFSTLGAADASGYYTVTLTAAPFPAGAKLRTIALQGYFTQAAGTNGIAALTARHTLSNVKAVSGEERRSVVDPAKCGNCHEVFEGHGGNRNIGKGTTGTIVCVVCHNPNLSSSGKTVNLAYEEETQNLKDMIHGIHAGAFRKDQGGAPFIHYRAKSGAASKYDWSEVVFPGILKTCETCHKPGTYGAIPAGALVTTNVTTDGTNATTAAVTAARASLPNATDKVISPFTGACVSCHNSSVAKGHMQASGGSLNVTRSAASAASAEQCVICHGSGRVADVTSVHK